MADQVRRRFFQATSPSAPLVTSVTNPLANIAEWTFDQTVTVAGSPSQMKVNGNSPSTNGTNTASNKIRVGYSGVAVGNPWSISATVTQVTPTPAFPQSGLVT